MFKSLKEEEQETKRIGKHDYEQTLADMYDEHALQQEAENNHILNIELADRETPTINQLETHLNSNPDHD